MSKVVIARRARPRSTVDTIVDTIKSMLRQRKLRPGDLIPSESELADTLGASRSSIREAMKVLSALGVVDIRRGDGTYVGSGSKSRLLDPVLFNLLVSTPEMDELVELRVMVETGIVGLVIRHAGAADIARLEAAYGALEEAAASGDRARLLESDLAFHATMGRASGNRLVETVYAFVIELFAPTMRAGRWLEVHRRLLDALRSRDLREAVAAVEEHDEIWRSLNQARQSPKLARKRRGPRGGA